MIEINLLPEELVIKKTKFSLKPELLIYLPVVAIVLFLLLHIFLAAFSIMQSRQLRLLGKKWEKLEPERKILDNLRQEYGFLSQDIKANQEITLKILPWAEKLNKLSVNLPSGIWFNELLISGKDFMLKGSTLSLQKEEVHLINQFIDNLKDDKRFFGDFVSLELGSVQRKTIASYDVVDFIITGKIK